jgi:DNA polymerase sigma
MNNKITYTKAIELLREFHKILIKRLKMFISSKRYPILRLHFKHFGDSLRSTGITCDLSLTNSLGIKNSKLIVSLCKLEPKFQILAIVLRFWAKLNGFFGSSQMSSYAFLMLVFFAKT